MQCKNKENEYYNVNQVSRNKTGEREFLTDGGITKATVMQLCRILLIR